MSHQHQAASSNTSEWKDPHNPPPMHLDNTCNSISYVHSKEKLNRSKLLKGEDWTAWEASENKQLDQNLNQKIFGQPCVPPSNCNLLPLIWTCAINPDGAKKARCACNGPPRQKGAVTVGNTYAASLEQSGARLFWILASLTVCQLHGADATNAFDYAPPPISP